MDRTRFGRRSGTGRKIRGWGHFTVFPPGGFRRFQPARAARFQNRWISAFRQHLRSVHPGLRFIHSCVGSRTSHQFLMAPLFD